MYMLKLAYSLLLVLSGLGLGYCLRYLVLRGTLSLPISIDALRKVLQKTGLLFFMPVSFMAAVWVIDFQDLRIILLPLIGLFALVSGGIYGYLYARAANLSPRRTGVLFCCCSFTNIGSIGALVCYMFLGEPGFALVALYKIFEEMYYYVIGFPIARYFSSGGDDHERGPASRFISVITDPFVATILAAFLTGLILNLTTIPRPAFFDTVNALFIPTGTFILIVSIGLGMHLSAMAAHMPVGLLVASIKSLAVPAGATTLAWLFGLGAIADGLALKVVLILSSMPTAFNSLVAASIYDLDLDMANSCWFISTMSLCIVLPVLYWLLNFL